MRTQLARVALLIVATLGSVSVIELGLRITTPPTLGQKPFPHVSFVRFDPVFGWRNVAGVESAEAFEKEIPVNTNSLGFRGPELAAPKPAATLRIVCLGDSGTFGWTRVRRGQQIVHQSFNYPAELSRLLHTRGQEHVEVVNAGVLGYSSSQGLRQLQLQVLPLDPDIVTLRFGFNDQNSAWAPESRLEEPSNPMLRTLLYQTARWRLVRLGLTAYASVAWLHPKPYSIAWVTREGFERNLRRFAEVGRQEGFQVLFMDYPLASPDDVNPSDVQRLIRRSRAGSVEAMLRRHAAYQATLRKVARHEGVPLLESAGAFASSAEPLFSTLDMVHPNREGSRRLAELLLQRLDELGWLETAGRTSESRP